MKKHIIFALSAVIALGFTSCSDDEKVEVGEWNAAANYANISFSQISTNIELDPSAPMSYAIQMTRPDSIGAVTVPVQVTSGDAEIISIEPAQFADGEKVADVVFKFPNAEVGKTYTVQYAVTDPKYVSYYSSAATGTFSVTRVKWNDVGFYYDASGQKVEGWAKYTDDCFTTFYNIQNLTWPTRIQERDDNPGYFRLINTYNDFGYNDPGDFDEDVDHYIYIDATNPNKVWIPEPCNIGTHWSYGYCWIYSMVGLGIDRGNQSYIDGNYGTYANGKITFPKDALLFGMDDYNNRGMYSSNNNGKFCVVLNPDLDVREAKFSPLGDEEGDFKWEEVFEGAFTSNQLKSTAPAKLYKGTCTVTDDDADKVFFETYGTPYVIEAPYAEGYDLYFFVKDGNVTLPSDLKLKDDWAEEEWDITCQETGIEALGMNTYAQINAPVSTFSPTEIVLNITFVTLDKHGDVDLELGNSEEVLANITWSQVATGTVYFSFFSNNEDRSPEADAGYKLMKRDDLENTFKIEQWGIGTDFMFTWNKTDNSCAVLEQSTGYVHPSYGEVFILEGAVYKAEKYGEHKSFYDPEAKTFHFFPVYFVDAGAFGQYEEVFEITEEGAVKHKVRNLLSLTADKSKNFMPWQGKKMWQPKKVQKTSPKTLVAPTAAPIF